MARFKEHTGVVLLGGSQLDPNDLDHLLIYKLPLYVADSGVVHLDVNRHKPKAIIGDFDSVSPLMAAAFNAEDCLLEDQNSTDFEKALDEIDAPYFLCLGFLGGRLDHELAAFNAITKRPEKNAIIVGEDSIAFVLPERFRMDLPPGTDIGLFPMAQVRADSDGLKWNLNEVKLSPSGTISTSNKVIKDRVEILVKTGKLICILPREQMTEVIRQVLTKKD